MSLSTNLPGNRPSAASSYLCLADAAARPAPAPGELLHLDCSALPYQRTPGVCHQVSQLLQLRQAGARILLHQVHPVLRHCLHHLRVAHLFAWAA